MISKMQDPVISKTTIISKISDPVISKITMISKMSDPVISKITMISKISDLVTISDVTMYDLLWSHFNIPAITMYKGYNDSDGLFMVFSCPNSIIITSLLNVSISELIVKSPLKLNEMNGISSHDSAL